MGASFSATATEPSEFQVTAFYTKETRPRTTFVVDDLDPAFTRSQIGSSAELMAIGRTKEALFAFDHLKNSNGRAHISVGGAWIMELVFPGPADIYREPVYLGVE